MLIGRSAIWSAVSGQVDLDLVPAHPRSGDKRQMSFLRVLAVDKSVDHRAPGIVATG
jgi:hypothetical protein